MLLLPELILNILKTYYPFKNPKENQSHSMRLTHCFAREGGGSLQHTTLLHKRTFFTQETMAGVPIPKYNINFENLVDKESKKY